MVGILSETPAQPGSPAETLGGPEALHRPDLALAWIYALLHQPDDIGLLGLRLAAQCVADLPDTDDARGIAEEVAERLSVAFADAALYQRGSRMASLTRTFSLLAASDAGAGAIINALRRVLEEK